MLAAERGLPLVAVQPIYCLSKEESPTLRLLAAIDLNVPLAEVPDAIRREYMLKEAADLCPTAAITVDD